MSSTTITISLSPTDTSFGSARNFLAKYASNQRCVPKPLVPLVLLPIKDGHIEEVVKKVRKIASEMATESFALSFSGVRQNSIGKIKLNVASRFLDKTNAMRNTIGAALEADLDEEWVSALCIYDDRQTATSVFDAVSSDPAFKDFSVEFDGLEILVRYGAQFFFRTSIYIDGQWQNAAQNKVLPVVNPSTRKTIHYIASATAEDVDRAVDAAQKAFPSWSELSATARAKYLVALADEIEARKDDIARLETLDNGKPLREAVADINDVITCFRYYADAIQQFDEKKQDEAVDVGDPAFSATLRYDPVGVCGLIIPWNYPLLMAAWKVAPCLAAGCTAVLKPSELTPMTALELAAIADAVGLPRGVLNIVNGLGPATGSPLANHSGVDKLAFTGSVATGSRIMEAATKAIKKISLELGGKSPIIVCKDADIDQAVDWVMVGIFFNQGQVCSATSRLLVHEDVKDQFLQRLKAETEAITISDGFATGSQLGPVVSEGQYKKILGYIRSGVEEGAKVLTGGGPVPNMPGFFLQPTVFVDVKPSMKIWKEEIFGPVLSVMSFTKEDEAIHLANDTAFGLAGAVISQSKETCQRIARRLRCGIVWVNCSQPTFIQLPWGGMKQSGIGRELGPWGLMNYLEPKQVTAWVDTAAKGWGWFKKSNL